MNDPLTRRKLIVVGIALAVGGLHVLTGPSYRGPWPGFVNGYLIDIVLPFTLVLLLGVARLPALRAGLRRAGVVFAIGAATEVLQGMGVPLFGQTFDPFDFAMFAVGALAGLAFESLVLDRIVPFRPEP